MDVINTKISPMKKFILKFLVLAFLLFLSKFSEAQSGSGFALDFDGTNDYVNIPSSTELTNLTSYTISGWVFFDVNQNFNPIFMKQSGTSSDIELYGRASDFVVVHNRNNGGTVDSRVMAAMPTNEWFHLAVTFESNELRIYRNGVLVDSEVGFATPVAHGYPVDLGRATSYGTYYMNSKLDEIRIWNGALTQSQIRDWMCKKVNASHPQYNDMVAYYRFDENSGSTLTDLKGSNDGTLTNAPTWITSGAALGDESSHDYGNGNATSVTQAHADGSNLVIDNFSGTPDGAHVYLVNEVPNSTTNSLSGNLDTTRYYGTFIVNGSSPTHTTSYNYGSNVSINGHSDEHEAVLGNRTDNTGTSWTPVTSLMHLNDGSNVITKCNESGRNEYIGGLDNSAAPDQRPGSGYAMDFDGINDYIVIPHSAEQTLTNFTLTTWIKTTQSASYSRIITKPVGGGQNYSLCVHNGRAHVRFDGSGGQAESTTLVNDGQWHHLAGVFDDVNNTLQIYVDGILEQTSAISGPPITGTDALFIGRFSTAFASTFFDGQMDEIEIFNTPLSQSEIRDWMCKKINSQHPKYCNLVAYYRFDENTGSTLKDYIGSNNGTLINGPVYALSGAAIGDESSHDYGNGNATTVTQAHADGSNFTLDNFTGTPDGAHVYLVNETPNTLTNSLSGDLDTSRYYGTFIVNGTSPTYTSTYDYGSNTNINGQSNESEAVFGSRTDNSGTIWGVGSSIMNLDAGTNTITKCGESGRNEYAGGFDNSSTFVQRPGSGYSLQFNGSSNYVVSNAPSVPDLTSFTIEAWVQPTSNVSWQSVMSFRNTAETFDVFDGFAFHIKNSGANGVIGFESHDLFPENTFQGTTNIVDGNWHHVAAVIYQGDRVELYVDGVLDNTRNTIASYTYTGQDELDLGVRYFSSSLNGYYNGGIDEVKIWTKALTQTEIRDWMCKKITSDHPDYCSLVSYYRFDENTGTILTDYVGTNSGTLTNGPVYALSGAAIGDESSHDYGNGNATSVTQAHADGSNFTINNFTGTPDGAHVYLVNETPNTFTNTLSGDLDTTRYYGTFIVNGTSPTYSSTYDYTNNANLDGQSNESKAVFAIRTDNTGTSWGVGSSFVNLDETANTIVKCNESGRKEYSGGFDNGSSLVQRPGSGYALNFDGSNDYVNIPNSSEITNITEYTVSGWLNLDVGGNYDPIFFKQSGSASDIEIYGGNGGITVVHNRNNGSTIALHQPGAGFPLPVGEWFHLAVTFSSNTITVYVNGEIHTSAGGKANPANHSYPVNLGRVTSFFVAGRRHYFNGQMDEMRVWDMALTQTEIRDWMCKKVTATHPQYCNLVSYYRFDENTGTTLTDYAGSNNGTLTNGPVYALSGAAIGDESTHDYGNGNATSVTQAHADGSNFTIDNFTGTPDGAHVYMVNETPNILTNTLSGDLDTTRYYGTFIVNGTTPTYSSTYDYTNNTSINGQSNESEAVFGTRIDNSGASWGVGSSSMNLDIASNTITKCGESGRKEYAGGFDNGSAFVQRPGSGYALDFDGSTNYAVNTAPNVGTLTSFTVEAWIQPTSTTSWKSIVSLRNSAETNGVFDGFAFHIKNSGANGVIGFESQDLYPENTFQGTTNVVDGNWHHVAAVIYQGDRVELYVDGVLEATRNSIASYTYNTQDILEVGVRYFSSVLNGYFQGSIDEVKLWNTTRTQTEIQDWMCKKVTSDHPQYCNLVSYYRFDENMGTTLTDYAGSNNGTLTNGPVYALSGAAIGDESSHDYGNGNATSVTQAHADGSNFTIDNFTGTPDGAHVYLVNETPNSSTTTLSGSLETTRYYGTFIVNGSAPTYSTTYDYTNNVNLNGHANEAEAIFGIRTDNFVPTWGIGSSAANLDAGGNTIAKCGWSGRKEYIAGFDNSTTLVQRPGSGYDLTFDGVNDFVAFSKVNLFSGLSYAAWIKTTSTDAAAGYAGNSALTIVGDHTNNVWNSFGVHGGKARYTHFTGSWQNVTGSSDVNDGEWHHIAVTHDQSTGVVTIYVDGISDATGNLSYGAGGGATKVGFDRIGGSFLNAVGTSDFFNGEIDEVTVFNTPVSQTTIRDWMCKKVTNAHPDYCNIVGYYRFDENAGSTLTDYINTNPGTLTNGPVYGLSGAPIGDESSYAYASNPIVSHIHADGDELTVFNFTGVPTGAHVYLVNEVPNTTTGVTGLGTNDRYFGVFKVGDTRATYKAEYDYNGNPFVGDDSEPGLTLYKRSDNAATSWADAGASLNTGTNTLLVSGESTEYILGSTTAPLPINQLEFEANLQEDQVSLTWTYIGETQVDQYEVQRSQNGEDWESIGFRKEQRSEYQFIDSNPLKRASYYRIKVINKEGAETYSHTEKVYFDQLSTDLDVYPNPVSDVVKIASHGNQIVRTQLTDLSGRLIWMDQNTFISKVYDLTNLEAGVYLMSVYFETGERKVVRLIRN